MNDSITAIKGLKVGHYTDKSAMTGCTVILCEQGAVCGVDVRGSAPGTRETDLLRGDNQVSHVHAVMLSGGSAFGLASACGAMRFLEKRGIGFDTGVARVPIVPAAILYDLDIGDFSVRPGEAQGYEACLNATPGEVPCGRVGCGTGATIGKMLGPQYASPGGVGCCALQLADGVIVAALIAVNALGDVYKDGRIIAGAKNDGVFLDCYRSVLAGAMASSGGTNTTIGVVATNAALTREEANKLASVAHDGLALSIRPIHTMYDGDTLFALSTCEKPCVNKVLLQIAAVEAVSRAVVNAVEGGRVL